MSLVNYSDSDASETSEEKILTKHTSTSKSSRSTFQKVVDRSDAGKAKISLPEEFVKQTEPDEPPAKKANTGTETLRNFNSFLPAPKRTITAASFSAFDTPTKRGVVNLKNGSAPGLNRDTPSQIEDTGIEYDASSSKDADLGANQDTQKNNTTRPESAGKPFMFKPLSVSRKPKNKKSTSNPRLVPVTPTAKTEKPLKVSLFSLSTDSEKNTSTKLNQGDYQTMIYDITDNVDEQLVGETVEPTYEDYTPTPSVAVPPAVPTPPLSNSLHSVAENLQLSASERRQLFGRNKGKKQGSAFNIINFNTDEEYSHNEELRAAGEQVVHNPVRSIAPGKHSLKQLVNAAQSQKEALEESFAKGKSNRAEASSRYGW